VAPVRAELRIPFQRGEEEDLIAIVNRPRSSIPAVTHVDYSARIQTVDGVDKPDFRDVIREFATLTGVPLVVNSSFNVRGEPIVCTPWDAYKCFMRTDMDILVMENCILRKEEQPKFEERENWREEYALD
jgi:carbamoyltransferase